MRRFVWLVAMLGWAACGGDGGTAGDDDDDAVGDDDDDAVGDDDDDDDGPAPLECTDTFTACGGDPVAAWTVTDFCSITIEELSVCPDLVLTVLADRSDGTVDISSDGRYSRTYNVDVDVEAAFSSSCLAPLPCSLVPTLSAGLITSCEEDAGTCTCQATVAEVDSAAGTWVVEGTDLVTDGTDRTAFCINGNQAVTQDDTARVHWAK